MDHMTVNEIREKFLKFFEGKGHLRLRSFSLVPKNDKSLLVINSGMAPMKPYFTGLETPPRKRVVNCQKCIRTNDIDNVGKSLRHGTFFEMLGNFSFGDYFKEEVIPWAWEFLTKDIGIPEDRLSVSVYPEDEEAYRIWNEKVGLAKEKIFRLEDNFWEVGLGPCGPDSEIFYDRGREYGCGSPDCAPGCDCDRFMEIWNLVFTQFSREEDGSLKDLAHPNIDTGMGLERMAIAAQGVASFFDIDTLKRLRDEVCRVSGKSYNKNDKDDYSIRVISDHIRSISFMIGDGIMPSNEGIGYVLKRLLRRAARHGKLLGIKGMFLSGLVNTVIEIFGEAYPELVEKKEYITKLVSVEELRFYDTLDAGTELLTRLIGGMKANSKTELDGENAFRLYDTFGFPPELMEEILDEQGFGLDRAAFDVEMQKQKDRARKGRKETNYMGAEETVFGRINVPAGVFEDAPVGILKASLSALVADGDIEDFAVESQEVYLFADKTCLYPEGGGQRGDGGIVKGPNGTAEIMNCQKVDGGRIAMFGKILAGKISAGDEITIERDETRRRNTAANHTATHILQKVLRDMLGNTVEQSGSLVTADRLRFDFTYFSALSAEQLSFAEKKANEIIMSGLPVTVTETSMGEARKMGAMALFSEKYGDTVRVVSVGDYSKELCGGTHVRNSSNIGLFKIISESGIAAGIRRIEAVTGAGALAYYKDAEDKLRHIAELTKTNADNAAKKVEQLLTLNRELTKEIESLRAKQAGGIIDEIIAAKESLSGLDIVSRVTELDIPSLKDMADKLREKLSCAVIILGGVKDGKASLIVALTDAAVKAGLAAGAIVKTAAAKAGGSGGGKPALAQAGFKDAASLETAMQAAREAALEIIGGTV